MKIKAIMGLGNPGSQFEYTRHNIGFRIVDALVTRFQGTWHSKDQMKYAELFIAGQKIIVIKPQTFMNLSGKTCPFLQKKGIFAEELLVVHDEMEKPWGNLSCKFGGSSKGHNGLKSIIGYYGQDFWRLRFGIGRPEEGKEEVSTYVLSSFLQPLYEVDRVIDSSVDLILSEVQKEN